MVETRALIEVCRLLNQHEVKYVVIGAYACILHGLVRTTEDVDILVGDSSENFQKVIHALSQMEDHAAAELTPQDFLDNVVIKIADEFEVDVSKSAWGVTFQEAEKNIVVVEIEGVRIPYLDLDLLIKSKSTYREKDIADRLSLLRLKALKSS